jgi:hypothetical protein
MGYRVVPLEVWGTGNAAEVIGISMANPKAINPKNSPRLNFPRAGLIYGAADSRAPAGSAAAP